MYYHPPQLGTKYKQTTPMQQYEVANNIIFSLFG